MEEFYNMSTDNTYITCINFPEIIQ